MPVPPEFRVKSNGEVIMSYAVFCSISRDKLIKMIEGNKKRGRK
jgi:hypothetical protein